MEGKELEQWITQLIKEDKLYKFYKSKKWKQKKEKILREFHNECAWCRKKGKISEAETVHHIQFVKKYPSLALSEFYTYQGEQHRNLVPLCHDCHDMAHGRMKYQKREQFNEERW